MVKKKSNSSILLEGAIFFIVMKILYEVLGVVFSAVQGDTRAIVAFFITLIIYEQVGGKIFKLTK